MSKTDKYLEKIDKRLAHLPPSSRSKLICQIEERIKAQKESMPESSEAQVLSSLGNPTVLVNEYLINAGLGPLNRKISFGMWIFITFISLMVIAAIVVAMLVKEFTPLIKIDDKKGRIVILGGLIDINSEVGSVKVGGHFDMDMKDTHQFKGSSQDGSVKNLIINFENGKFLLKKSSTSAISWDCNLSSPTIDGTIKTSGKKLSLNFTEYHGSQCDISVPEKLSLFIQGENGNIEFDRPNFHSDVELENGMVIFNQMPNLGYDFDTKVEMGHISEDNLMEDKGGLKAKIRLERGSIIIK